MSIQRIFHSNICKPLPSSILFLDLVSEVRVCSAAEFFFFSSWGHKTAKTTRPKWGSIQQSAISSEFHSVDLKQRHSLECFFHLVPPFRKATFFPWIDRPMQDMRISGINTNHQSTSNPFLSLVQSEAASIRLFGIAILLIWL